MMTFELRHLRYFVAVAEELSFTRAAERLHIAQPPLSQQVRDLEHTVGTPLFRRSSRRVELTPAGVVFLEGARRTLAEAARAAQAAQRAASGIVDTIRVGYTDSAALSILPGALRSFRAAHPGVHLDLTDGSTQLQLIAVERGAIDIALIRGPVARASLRTQIIFRESFVAALPAGHALARVQRLSLRTLANEPVVLFPRQLAPEFHDSIVQMFRRAGASPNLMYEAAEYQTILSLIAGGLGVSVLPSSVHNLKRAGVVYRPLPSSIGSAQIVAAYREDSTNLAVGAFVSLAKDAAG